MKHLTLLLFLAIGAFTASAQDVQAQYKQLIEQRSEALTTLLRQIPYIETFSYKVDKFKAAQDTSSATTSILVKPTDEKKLTIKANAEITHDAQSKENGLIFESKESFIPNKRMPNELQLFLLQSTLVSKYTSPEHVVTTFYTKPTDYVEKSGGSVNFKGLQFTLAKTAPGQQQFTFKFEGYSLINKDARVSINPFSIGGKSEPSGRFDFRTSSIVFDSAQKKKRYKGSIQSISGDGNLQDKAGISTGETHFAIKDFSLTGSTQIRLEKVLYDSQIDVNDKLISQEQHIDIVANPDDILDFTDGQFGFTTMKIDIMANNVSIKTQKIMESLQREGSTLSPKAQQKRFVALLDGFRGSNASLSFGSKVQTADGALSVNADLKFHKKGPSTSKLFSNPDPKSVLKIVDFDVDLVLPQIFVESLGNASPMPLQMFMQLKGDSYVTKIVNTSGKLTINGKPAPF